MNTLISISLFVVGSAVIVYVSRASLLHPQSHGFYRFFAWEILLAMFLMNMKGWFRNPLAWHQVISWVLLILSLFLVIHGVMLLKEIGKQDKTRQDSPLVGLEKTSQLVMVGAYRYIRHPLYSSLLCLGWGIYFKSPSLLDATLALACTLFLASTARMEEQEDIKFFGEAYREYMKRTKMFIPFVF